MEHACQKCGTLVEDGRPFCPHCRAPQISVKIAVIETEADAVPRQDDERPSGDTLLPSRRPDAFFSALDRGIAARAALKAGVLGAAVGMMIPVVGVLVAGASAVFFYRRENGLTPRTRIAARVGAAAGVVAFAVDYVIVVASILALHAQQQYITRIEKVWQRLGINPADPDLHASLQNLFSPSGLALAFCFGVMIAIVLAAIGGALGSLFMRSDHPDK